MCVCVCVCVRVGWNVCVCMYGHTEVTSAQITSLAVNLKAPTKQTHLELIWAFFLSVWFTRRWNEILRNTCLFYPTIPPSCEWCDLAIDCSTSMSVKYTKVLIEQPILPGCEFPLCWSLICLSGACKSGKRPGPAHWDHQDSCVTALMYHATELDTSHCGSHLLFIQHNLWAVGFMPLKIRKAPPRAPGLSQCRPDIQKEAFGSGLWLT